MATPPKVNTVLPTEITPGDEILFQGSDLGVVTTVIVYKSDGATQLTTLPATPKGAGTEASTNRALNDNFKPQNVKLAVTDGTTAGTSNLLDAQFTNA